MPDKPPYRVPSMAEVKALPWNGLTAASTFSGCGGSSLGYRMAGYRIAYANEFIPAARETYRANASPRTYLDGRDIRTVTGPDFLRAAGVAEGELDLLDGSPPCASFSTAGRRHKAWGVVKEYSDTKQRSDDLFFEFARILDAAQPRAFVAENVSGLIKGTAKGYFIEIMRALKGCGYRVEAKLLDAQWLGVPQARQRLIFVGVRADLPARPAFPSPLPYRYTVREALPWITEQARCTGGYGPGNGQMMAADAPSPTFGASPQSGSGWWPPSIVRVVHDTGGQPSFSSGDVTDRPSPTITVGENGLNSRHYRVENEGAPTWADPETGASLRLSSSRKDLTRCRKLTLAELRRLCGFPDDFALTGTYAQRWERLGRAVPPVMMAHVAAAVRDRVLLPSQVTA